MTETVDDIEAARPYIAEALEHAAGTHTVDDVVRQIRAGDLQLWPGPRCAVVTRLAKSPNRLTLHFFLAAGENIAAIQPLLPIIYAWARERGATHASFTGRPGWVRSALLRDEPEWELKYLTYERVLP